MICFCAEIPGFDIVLNGCVLSAVGSLLTHAATGPGFKLPIICARETIPLRPQHVLDQASFEVHVVPILAERSACTSGDKLERPVRGLQRQVQVSGDKEACAKLAEIAKPEFKAGVASFLAVACFASNLSVMSHDGSCTL